MDSFFEVTDRKDRVWLAPAEDLANYGSNFVELGRQQELRLCRAAFAIKDDWSGFDETLSPLHFRLEGPPGVGKNEIVYEVARQMAKNMGLPFYSIQGHEEMTPEDLSILFVPAADAPGDLKLGLRASPLATALYEGGFFFFDEINRAPERALAPLASVLDSRRSLYSAATGIRIEAKTPELRKRFRFCSAMNPEHGKSGRGGLSDYLDERTLPVIRVGYHDTDTLLEILRRKVTSDSKHLDTFKEWYHERTNQEVSVRQILSLVHFAFSTIGQVGSFRESLDQAAGHTLRKDQIKSNGTNGAGGESETSDLD